MFDPRVVARFPVLQSTVAIPASNSVVVTWRNVREIIFEELEWITTKNSWQITHPRKRILLLPLVPQLHSSATLAIRNGTSPILQSSPPCEDSFGCCKETRFGVEPKMFKSYGHWKNINLHVTHSNRVNGTVCLARAAEAGTLASFKKHLQSTKIPFSTIFVPTNFQ